MIQRFYFNVDENLCVNEDWLVDYLHRLYSIDKDEIISELRSCREYFGWYECSVSSDIWDKFQ